MIAAIAPAPAIMGHGVSVFRAAFADFGAVVADVAWVVGGEVVAAVVVPGLLLRIIVW